MYSYLHIGTYIFKDYNKLICGKSTFKKKEYCTGYHIYYTQYIEDSMITHAETLLELPFILFPL